MSRTFIIFIIALLPLRQYLDQDVALSQDLVHKHSDVVLAKLNKSIVELRRLFLVEDLVDSIKVSPSSRWWFWSGSGHLVQQLVFQQSVVL